MFLLLSTGRAGDRLVPGPESGGGRMTAAQARLQVAVVIPTYKRPDLLRRCLEAVAAQYMPAGSYEIVVADDFPMDANRSVVAEMQPAWAMERGRPLISYVPVDGNHGP